jgi:hypothetical protein
MAAINHNNDPAFWHLPIDVDTSVGAETPHAREHFSDGSARAETLAMVISWFGEPLSEEDALDLALSRTIE